MSELDELADEAGGFISPQSSSSCLGRFMNQPYDMLWFVNPEFEESIDEILKHGVTIEQEVFLSK